MKEVNRLLYRARAKVARQEARLLRSLARLGLITALTSQIVGISRRENGSCARQSKTRLASSHLQRSWVFPQRA